ncbi:hypothetical protein [Glycomyces buryatensis]|uniref:Uncharacterized protein n=1 Tax=Glycomyces buryatensis TaxID=2570927 RepID=A0A4S8QCS4_9ACTN|nr:hypothetical protein [Glycomyces buryatensis]THV41381.1 hypothetical protein FAB82_11980 [Glycomyces buryatensis]
MTATIAPIKVSSDQDSTADYTVELTDRTATVRYRSKLWPDEETEVARIDHRDGRIAAVAWGETWQRMWSSALRVEVIARVQHLLIEHGPLRTRST